MRLKKKVGNMKTLTCRQMAGACDAPIAAETFEEAVKAAQAHGMEMMQDPAHKEVMEKVMHMSPEEQQKMVEDVRALWDVAPSA